MASMARKASGSSRDTGAVAPARARGDQERAPPRTTGRTRSTTAWGTASRRAARRERRRPPHSAGAPTGRRPGRTRSRSATPIAAATSAPATSGMEDSRTQPEPVGRQGVTRRIAVLHAAGGGARSSRRRSASRSSTGCGRAAAGRARLRNAVACDVRDGLLAGRRFPAVVLSPLVVLGTRRHVPGRRAHGRRHRAGVTAAAAGLPRHARHGVCPAWPARGRARERRRGCRRRRRRGADLAVATAVVYGIMALVASLPGALVLLWAWLPRARPPAQLEPPHPVRVAVVARQDGARDDDRPYTLLRCSVSIDGYIGSAASPPAPVQRRRLRPGRCGPRLVRRDPGRSGDGAAGQPAARGALQGPPRRAQGARACPVADEGDRRPGGPSSTRAPTSSRPATPRSSSTARPRESVDARARLGPVATVVDGGRIVQMPKLSADLAERGVERLMVEGGGKVHTQSL